MADKLAVYALDGGDRPVRLKVAGALTVSDAHRLIQDLSDAVCKVSPYIIHWTVEDTDKSLRASDLLERGLFNGAHAKRLLDVRSWLEELRDRADKP